MKIKKINGIVSDINIVSDAAKEHFANPYNYTKEILAQFDSNLYKDFISEQDKTFLDIGANAGLFALHISPYAEKIICVEPTPEHMAIQKEILTGYPVIHEQSAINDKTEDVKFHWCGINTTMNSLQERGDRFFIVNGITLNDLLLKHKIDKIDFAKIDVEGSEWSAITTETIKPVFDKINKVFIELHPPDSNSQEIFKTIFESVGYKVEKAYHDSLYCYK